MYYGVLIIDRYELNDINNSSDRNDMKFFDEFWVVIRKSAICGSWILKTFSSLSFHLVTYMP